MSLSSIFCCHFLAYFLFININVLLTSAGSVVIPLTHSLQSNLSLLSFLFDKMATDLSTLLIIPNKQIFKHLKRNELFKFLGSGAISPIIRIF